MKGNLFKDLNGKWIIIHLQPTLNGPLLQSLPLIQESFDINSPMKPVVELKEGIEVDFEIVDYSQKCKECGEIVERGRSCKKGCFMKSGNYTPTIKTEYAKII